MKNQSSQFRDAVSFYQSGNYHKSIAICESLINKEHVDEGLSCLLIDNNIKLGNNAAAAEHLQTLLTHKPENAQYHFLLATMLSNLGNLSRAREHLKTAVKLDPSKANVWAQLSGIAGQLGYYDEAMSAGIQAVTLSPSSLNANLNLAAAYDALNLTDKALECYLSSAKLAPAHPVVLCKLGDAYITCNNRQEAENCYRKAIAADPAYTQPYRQLSRLCSYKTTQHEDFDRLNQAVNSPAINQRSKSNLYFALGKMYEDCNSIELSFDNYQKGNVLENRLSDFSAEKFVQTVDDIIGFFNQEYFQSVKYEGLQSDVPVFVVGMPRSGTTLIEQILASHPQCYGGGELYWFGQIESNIKKYVGASSDFPESVNLLTQETANKLAADYLDHLNSVAGETGYKRITDKLPGNFLHLGIISSIIPNAHIINCRRNPLDTCFSIYSILFPGNLNFSHDLDNIATVYNQYERLMKHWEQMLPGKILTVNYEDVVLNQEAESKRIIDYIELPWDEACLDISSNANRVNTVSAFQVRKGIYSNAINRWKKYEKHLAPLLNALDPDLLSKYDL